MQSVGSSYLRIPRSPWALAAIGLFIWPVLFGFFMLGVYLRPLQELCGYIMVGLMFIGLTFCVAAAHVRPGSFARQMGFLVLLLCIWAGLGAFTFYLIRSLPKE